MPKLDYKAQNETREPMAYIDKDGDLVLRAAYDDWGDDAFCWDAVNNDGMMVTWNPFHEENQKFFYRGDKLTITF